MATQACQLTCAAVVLCCCIGIFSWKTGPGPAEAEPSLIILQAGKSLWGWQLHFCKGREQSINETSLKEAFKEAAWQCKSEEVTQTWLEHLIYQEEKKSALVNYAALVKNLLLWSLLLFNRYFNTNHYFLLFTIQRRCWQGPPWEVCMEIWGIEERFEQIQINIESKGEWVAQKWCRQCRVLN